MSSTIELVLNNNGQITQGVVFEDNNSINGIGYALDRYGLNSKRKTPWNNSYPTLKIGPNETVDIYLQYEELHEGAIEFRQRFNWDDSFTNFGDFDRIRLSDDLIN